MLAENRSLHLRVRLGHTFCKTTKRKWWQSTSLMMSNPILQTTLVAILVRLDLLGFGRVFYRGSVLLVRWLCICWTQ